MKVILVEDEVIVAVMIRSLLEHEGYEVIHAETGEDGWSILESDPSFDLIILDRQLPGISGLDLLRKVKATEHLKNIPVVMETGMGRVEHVREGLEAGAYYYLTKPFDAKKLLAVVSAALEQVREFQGIKAEVLTYESALQLLQNCEFAIRTLDEARALAQTLATLAVDRARALYGLQELLINAVEHGNLEISYDEKTELMLEGRWEDEVIRRLESPVLGERSVKVTLKREPGSCYLTIADQGKGFDWQKYWDLSPDRAFDPHGRGIALSRMNSLESVQFLGAGNIVSVEIKTA